MLSEILSELNQIQYKETDNKEYVMIKGILQSSIFGESLTSEALSNTLQFRLASDEFYRHKFNIISVSNYTVCAMGAKYQLGSDCLGQHFLKSYCFNFKSIFFPHILLYSNLRQ